MVFRRVQRLSYGFATLFLFVFLSLWLVVNHHVFRRTPGKFVDQTEPSADSAKQINGKAVLRKRLKNRSSTKEDANTILKDINSTLWKVLKKFHQLRVATTTRTTTSGPSSDNTNETIDIVNDYYPFVDFKFVFPEMSPTNVDSRNFFMIVLVNSGPTEEYRNRRETIRQTWGSQSNCEQRKALSDGVLKDLKWLLVFVVGKAGPGTNDDELNMAEAKQNNDMLIGNITENYLNNVIKFYMGQVWASRFDIKYTMKTDDDVYVRIPRVIEYLVNNKLPRPFYGGWTYAGTRVNRVIGGKWTVSWKYYGEVDWPRFNPGAFFILSSDLLNRLFNYVHIRKPFHTDDAYVGVAMRDFGVKITTIYSFRISPDMNKQIPTLGNCYLLGKIALGHNVDPKAAKILFNRLESMICGRKPEKC